MSISEAATKTNFVLYNKGDRQFVLQIHAIMKTGYACSYFGVMTETGMEPCFGDAYLSPDTEVTPIL